jgi:hypothetical protein
MIDISNATSEEIYKLMDNSDYFMYSKSSPLYIALNNRQMIIAVGTFDRVQSKAIIRGCEMPRVLSSEYFSKEQLEKHNNLLEKALLNNKNNKN